MARLAAITHVSAQELALRYNLSVVEVYAFRRKYCDVRSHAKSRGLVCDISFPQYMRLVLFAKLRSAKDIGNSRHKYQLARKGDTGGYSWGNCRFVTTWQNRQESVANGGQELGNARHSGVLNGHAKLTEAKVRSIRRLAKAGKTHEWLCTHFGVSSLSTMNDVIHHRSWRGVK